ncbi:MAG: hypothetical protein AB7P21_26075 [Lautropia sp.]
MADARASSDADTPRIAPSNWDVVPDTGDGAIELSYRDGASELSLHCGSSGCALFVEPRSGCFPGLVYPLLLNSASQVGIAPSTCVTVAGRGALRDSPRTGVLIGPDTEFVAGLFVGEPLTVAFPATEGGMEVVDVSVDGLPEALASAREQQEGPPSPGTRGDDRGAAIARVLRHSETQHEL